MPSPFPGMDPYLEGEVWSDVHQALAGEVRRQLNPRLGPKYAARLAVRIEVERRGGPDGDDFGDADRVWADVDVRTTAPGWEFGPESSAAAVTPKTMTVPLVAAVHWKLVTVEVRHVDRNTVVAAVEILSPVNKRRPGLRDYRRKRRRYWERGVHLVELDLLRRGVRPFPGPEPHSHPYFLQLAEAGRPEVDLWAVGLRDPLPTVPVPLLPGDEPIALDLAAAFAATYEAGAYDRSIDYDSDPPAPPLSANDAAFVTETLAPLRKPAGDVGG